MKGFFRIDGPGTLSNIIQRSTAASGNNIGDVVHDAAFIVMVMSIEDNVYLKMYEDRDPEPLHPG